MLTPHPLAFLQGGRTIRRVRSDIQRRIQGEPALRMLPGLLQLPIAPAPLPDPAAILAHRGGIALCGPPTSGRSLVLLQIQARWADTGKGGPIIALALAAADVPNLSPRAIVAGAIHRAGLAAKYAEGGRPMILLLDDWEDLPPDRRALWRSYTVAAASWATARVVICLPPGEVWFGLTCLDLVAPDDAALATWLARLLPAHDPDLIMAALACEPLAALRDRIGDLLLLALIYPIIGLPLARAQLYEQAYALALPLLDNPEGALSVGQAALRHYRLARSLADGADLAPLTALPAHEIAAVAPLAAGLLNDPRPVLDLLWADGDPAPPAMHGLAACLRDRPAVTVDNHLRLVELLLAQGVHDHDALIAPGLPDMFASASRGDQTLAIRALGALVKSWPGHQTMGLLLHLIDHPDATVALRWAAADLLASGPGLPTSIADIPVFADDIALAARAHIIALAVPAQRRMLLDPNLRPGMAALIAGASGVHRWAAVAAALIDDPQAPSELRALALAGAPESAEGDAILRRSLASRSPALRRAALDILLSRHSNDPLHLLGAALAEAEPDEDVHRDLLTAMAQLPQREATGLIARYALAAQASPALRVAALGLLPNRPGCVPLLQGFLAAEGMPTLLRAATAQILGAMGEASAVPLLRHILLGDRPPLLRRAAAAGLADLARVHGRREAAVTALIDAIAQPDLDAALTASIAAALGAVDATRAVPALTTLLDPERPAALRAAWCSAAPDLARTSADLWPTLSLESTARVALLDSLASGETIADQPSSLDELCRMQAEHAAVAAAESMADLAVRHPALASDLCARIRRAILATPGPPTPTGLMRALARAAGEHMTSELEALLDAAAGTPSLRWAALDLLGHTPQAADWLRVRLRSAADDIFTCGKLAEILGDLGDLPATPDLRAIAANPAGDSYLRMCAIGALGRIGAGEAAAALLQIIKDDDTPPSLRAAAIDALPYPFADEARRVLHQIAQADGLAPPLATAICQRLARAGEYEIMPLLLRGAQSEQPHEAITMIDAICDLGDQSAVPMLVRISQSALAAPGVRLAAVAALLHLDGPANLPLLYAYLDSPMPPLRIMAHQILAQIDPGDIRLSEPVATDSAPLALRLASLAQMITRSPAISLLAAIITHPDEPPQLRLGIAGALGRAGQAEATRALQDVLSVGGPPLLRRRCIAALGELAAAPGEAGQTARASIATLVQSHDAPAEERHWAAEILLDRARPKDIR